MVVGGGGCIGCQCWKVGGGTTVVVVVVVVVNAGGGTMVIVVAWWGWWWSRRGRSLSLSSDDAGRCRVGQRSLSSSDDSRGWWWSHQLSMLRGGGRCMTCVPISKLYHKSLQTSLSSLQRPCFNWKLAHLVPPGLRWWPQWPQRVMTRLQQPLLSPSSGPPMCHSALIMFIGNDTGVLMGVATWTETQTQHRLHLWVWHKVSLFFSFLF